MKIFERLAEAEAASGQRLVLIESPGRKASREPLGLPLWALTASEMLLDAATVAAAIAMAYLIYFHLHLGRHLVYSPLRLLIGALVSGGLFVFLLEARGGYTHSRSLLHVKETETILAVSVTVFFIVLGLSFFLSQVFSRHLVAISLITVPISVILEKQATYELIERIQRRRDGIRRVLIFGSGSTARQFFSTVLCSPKLGLQPVCFLDEDSTQSGVRIYEAGYKRRRFAPVLTGRLTRELLKELEIDEVFVAISPVSSDDFARIAEETSAAGAALSFAASNAIPTATSVNYFDLDGVLVTSFSEPASRSSYEFLKRTFDIVLSTALLLLCLPVWICVAAAIKLSSPGPVLFAQERLGKHGKQFRMIKFRTMQCEAPNYALSPSTSADPRLTRFGRWLRRTGLDELPQLINVLAGDMSLVGPRPEQPFIAAGYTPVQRQRLQVTPGITGLWQLSADRNYLIHENIEYDFYYIRHRNLLMDVAILLHTIVFVFAMRGV